jgi:dsRNA-specific ribonuclease
MNLLNIENLINYNFNNKNILDGINIEDALLFSDYIINYTIDNKIKNELFYYSNNKLEKYYDFKEISDFINLIKSDDYLNERIIKIHLNNDLAYDNQLNDFKLLIAIIIMDSNNYELIENLLNLEDALINKIDSKKNYSKLIFEWMKRKYNKKPQIEVENGTLILSLEGIDKKFSTPLKTKIISILEASKNAYKYIEDNNLLLKMTDIVGLPDQDRCINQLQELFAKGFINEPVYKIAMKGTNNGVDIWKCRILIDGYTESFSAEDTSKKNAKRLVAYQMLKYIIDNE